MKDAMRKILLLNWFTNLYSNCENKEVVLLFCESSKNETIHYNLNCFHRSFNCHISDINKRSYLKEYIQNVDNVIFKRSMQESIKNFIFLVDANSVSEITQLMNFFSDKGQKILFALEEDAVDTFNKISTSKIQDIEPIGFPDCLNYYLNGFDTTKQGLIALLKNDELKPYLSDFIKYRNDFIKRFFRYDSYLDKDLNGKINEDLELLKHKNLLTSNLAMHLYRLYFFKPEANPTETGRYFRESFGDKSITCTPKSKKLKSFVYRPNKNFKAYDLSTNMEKRIRNDIASKLIQFIKLNPNKVLDTYSIADIAHITYLSVEDVEEIFES
ncbi:MAG: hypothetical protein JZU62_10875 [Sulfuricurvum sp.]|uniref:hypothetical protein n=1 Tax=Sulfuricurvum sp. TaxID=2025608 RepID=UPI0025DDB6DE|nr:hypothetical protein [Sulfuricurvum sp.]MBV5322186.1 hypothetical protein [Sulfuricurvum sp.]